MKSEMKSWMKSEMKRAMKSWMKSEMKTLEWTRGYEIRWAVERSR